MADEIATPPTVPTPKRRFSLPFISHKPKEIESMETTPESESEKTVSFLLNTLKEQDEFLVFKAKKTTFLLVGATLIVLLGGGLLVWFKFL